MEEINNTDVSSSVIESKSLNQSGKSKKIMALVVGLLIVFAIGFVYKYYTELWEPKNVFGQVPEAASDELVYKNYKYGYSFVYPADWQIVAQTDDLIDADKIWLVKSPEAAPEEPAEEEGASEEIEGGGDEEVVEEFEVPAEYYISINPRNLNLLIDADPEFKVPENSKLWVQWQRQNESEFGEVEGEYEEKRIVVSGIPSVRTDYTNGKIWISLLGPHKNYSYRLEYSGGSNEGLEKVLSTFTFVKDISLSDN